MLRSKRDRDDVVAAGRPEAGRRTSSARPSSAVRVGALRGRCSRWCSRLSPVIQASMNGSSSRIVNISHGQHDDRQHDVPAEIVTPTDVRLPAGHDPQRAVRPAHVPVGLGARRHLGRVVGAVLPDRVDRQQRPHQGGDAEDDEEEPAGLGGVHRAASGSRRRSARCGRGRATGCACGRRAAACGRRSAPAAGPGSAARGR